MREVEGSSPTEQKSAPISVFTEEIVVIVVLGFVDTFTKFLCYFYVVVGPASEQETCALIGYQRVQNLFSFGSLVDSPKKEKGNACSLLNTSNNVVNKQFILVI